MGLEDKTIDPAAQKILSKAQKEGVQTVWERKEEMKVCAFGDAGTCCRICWMGPCRINPKAPEEKRGVCGATADTIAARNLARMVAAGTSAHSDHGRHIVHALKLTSEGRMAGYEVRDISKLYRVAGEFGIDTRDREINEIAHELAEKAEEEFGKQEGRLTFLNRAPKKRQKIWHESGVEPRGIDREVVDLLHRTAMGVDHDHVDITLSSMRTSLADGWGGSMLATELSDILLSTPYPIRSKANLGVLEENAVNIIVHGHEPLLSDSIARVVREPEMIEKAKQAGATEGINLSGLCCTGNEVLMRQGYPLAGNHLHQELAIITGAVEAMVIDVQCQMPSLAQVASYYHTHLITTSPQAKFPGVMHIAFEHEKALEIARKIVTLAIENFKNRDKSKVHIPEEKMDLVAGFSHETINYMLGGRFRASYRPLNDAIIWGRIKGVVGIVGCNNPRIPQDSFHVTLAEELIKNDILVVSTGCAAGAFAKAGLLLPEAAEKAGPGLREVCEAVGMPPVLHAGACVDNSRILVACCEMVREGGLGNDISDLPVAGVAPEWMSEKAEAIAHYFVASGVNVFIGVPHPTWGSPGMEKLLYEDLENIFGARFHYEPEPYLMATKIIDLINKKREKLGITEKPVRVLYDMAMRRELPVE